MSKAELYPHRPELASKPVWVCQDCGARVGCHPGTTRPLGTCAGLALRNARTHVHAVLDPHWKSGRATRTEVYAYLADRMKLSRREAHIGMFGIEQCREAWRIMKDANFGGTSE